MDGEYGFSSKLLNTFGWIFGACKTELLDFVTQLIAAAYSWSTSEECTKWDTCVEIRYNIKAEHLMAQHGETRIYILEVELKMDASQAVE